VLKKIQPELARLSSKIELDTPLLAGITRSGLISDGVIHSKEICFESSMGVAPQFLQVHII
jgi:hypothetical protein